MLTNYEIGEKINENLKKIKEGMNVTQFVLDNTIRALVEENKLLQKQCTHDFNENNICIYCKVKKEDN